MRDADRTEHDPTRDETHRALRSWTSSSASVATTLSSSVARIDLRALTRALSTLVDAEVEPASGVLDVVDRDQAPSAGASQATYLVLRHALDASASFALEIDPVGASWIVERVLGGTGEDATAGAAAALDEMERGVLAFACARCLAECAAPYVLVDVTDRASAFEALSAASVFARWPVVLDVGGRRVAMRAWLPPDATRPARRPTSATVGASLAAVEIETSLVIERLTLTTDALSRLRVGDVILFDRASFALDDGALRGEATLELEPTRTAEPASTVHVSIDGDRLIVRAVDHGRLGPMPSTPAPSNDPDRVAIRADLEIPLRAEVARLRLTLGELAALAPGAVLPLGTTLDARVSLLIGDRTVATGTLVELDGELGVQLDDVRVR